MNELINRLNQFQNELNMSFLPAIDNEFRFFKNQETQFLRWFEKIAAVESVQSQWRDLTNALDTLSKETYKVNHIITDFKSRRRY